MPITKAAASRILGISKAAISKWERKPPRPGFFIEVNGKIKIDDSHPEWLNKIEESNKKKIQSVGGKVADGIKKKNGMKKSLGIIVDGEKQTPGNNDKGFAELSDQEKNDIIELQRNSEIASLKKEIYESDIKREKALQEEIKTMASKKDLAPIELLKHFFSYSENMIGRLYRRPHEISPQLSALYLAGEDKKAVQLIIKNNEEIVKGAVADLIKGLKEEGYRIKGMGKVKK